MILRTYFTSLPRLSNERHVSFSVSVTNEMSEPVWVPCSLSVEILASDGVTPCGGLMDQSIEELEPFCDAWHVQVEGALPADIQGQQSERLVHVRAAAQPIVRAADQTMIFGQEHVAGISCKRRRVEAGAPQDCFETALQANDVDPSLVSILPCTSMPLGLMPQAAACVSVPEYCFRSFNLLDHEVRIREELTCYQMTTGGRLWDAGIVLADCLVSCFGNCGDVASSLLGQSVIELSCGCGLPGITASLLQEERRVLLTDQSEVIPLTRINVSCNISSKNSNVAVAELNWTLPSHLEDAKRNYNKGEPFDVILLADALYSRTTIKPLHDAILALSKIGTVVLLAHKHRGELWGNTLSNAYGESCSSTGRSADTPPEARGAKRKTGFRLPLCTLLATRFDICVLQDLGDSPSNVVVFYMRRVQ